MSPEPKPPDAPSILRAEGCAAGRGWRGCARCAGGGSRARASTPAAAPPRAPAPAPAPAIPAAPPGAQDATSGSEAPIARGGEVTPPSRDGVGATPPLRHASGGGPGPHHSSWRGMRESGAGAVGAGCGTPPTPQEHTHTHPAGLSPSSAPSRRLGVSGRGRPGPWPRRL